MDEVSIENRFLFDLQGFLLLRGVLSKTECSDYDNKLRVLEQGDYADSWQESLPPDSPGLDMPGAIAATGQAGDLLLFSEAVIHDGLPKTTTGLRSNLYYNYVHAHYNVVMREPRNAHHFYFPPEIRARFDQNQQDLTKWM
jgi:hypothetical protein